ncbi:MAG: hypothetical protein IV100_06895 [Myxococcales bacterium]|nr:hypothetical protein [Myxococcales bacterium]
MHLRAISALSFFAIACTTDPSAPVTDAAAESDVGPLGDTAVGDVAATEDTQAPDSSTESDAEALPDIAADVPELGDAEPVDAPKDDGTPEDTGLEDTGTTDADATDTAAPIPLVCDPAPTLPRPFEILYSFTTSEDFAFDGEGNLVSNDGGTLVKQKVNSSKKPYVPGFGDTAGMRYLPNGDLAVSNLQTGTIDRVTPDGSSSVILSGMQYANGLEVDSLGYIYVAEQNAGRVRRIDAATGEFIVVGQGMSNPNGTSLSPDETILYVGSFGAGVIYAIDLTDEDHMGATTVFGRVPGIPPGSGAVSEPCAGLTEGASCDPLFGGNGTCAPFGGVLDCIPAGSCDGKEEGDACDEFGAPGICTESFGGLVCQAATPCAGLTEGSTCESPFGKGICTPGWNGLSCAPIVCWQKPEGSDCPLGEGTGTCVMGWEGFLECQFVDPCQKAGSQAGAPCPLPDGTSGVCSGEPGFLWCQYFDPCTAAGTASGSPCTTPLGVPGICKDPEGFGLACQPKIGCTGLAVGAVCYDGATSQKGTCVQGDTKVVCEPPNACDGKLLGETCFIPGAFVSGVCELQDGVGPALTCQFASCDVLGAGVNCMLASGDMGTCSLVNAELVCKPPTSCDGLVTGLACVDDEGEGGVCFPGAQGWLVCGLPTGCGGLPDGFACVLVGGDKGSCVTQEEVPTCLSKLDVAALPCATGGPGTACEYVFAGQGYSGECVEPDPPNAELPPRFCQGGSDAVVTCKGKVYGDPCVKPGGLGECQSGLDGLSCQDPLPGGGGGLDGINVDACGNVYVTEYVVGRIYRFGPEGGLGKLATVLPSSWIPNMHFGAGIGGWQKDRLYVADRDQGRIFVIDTGVPGSPDAFPDVWGDP